MIKQTILLVMCSALIVAGAAHAQTTAKDYLNIPGPLVFDNQRFNLDWTSHPAPGFYKQEYLIKGDITGKYKIMLLIDVITGSKSAKEAAAEKLAELKNLKAGNPAVNYESFGNAATGEYMIDFILSANTPDGKQLSIAERSVYRYKSFTDKNGHKGVLLFGVSTRAYGNGISSFFASLKTNKQQLVNQVAKYNLPEISITK